MSRWRSESRLTRAKPPLASQVGLFIPLFHRVYANRNTCPIEPICCLLPAGGVPILC